MAGETPYVETEILLALLNDNEEEAISLIQEMTERERSELMALVSVMRDLLNRKAWCLGCGGFISRGREQLGPMYPDRWHPACAERRDATVADAITGLSIAARNNPRWAGGQ